MMDNKCNSEINFPKFSENVVRLFDVLVITVNKQDLCGCVHSVVFTVLCSQCRVHTQTTDEPPLKRGTSCWELKPHV